MSPNVFADACQRREQQKKKEETPAKKMANFTGVAVHFGSLRGRMDDDLRCSGR
jgi:hypothetical protein